MTVEHCALDREWRYGGIGDASGRIRFHGGGARISYVGNDFSFKINKN
jgi:hypothetical protein